VKETCLHENDPSCAICDRVPLSRAAEVEWNVDQGTSLAGLIRTDISKRRPKWVRNLTELRRTHDADRR